MKRSDGIKREGFTIKDLNGLLAYAAAMMLTGVPPLVCETVLDEFYGVVRKSFERIKA